MTALTRPLYPPPLRVLLDARREAQKWNGIVPVMAAKSFREYFMKTPISKSICPYTAEDRRVVTISLCKMLIPDWDDSEWMD